MTSFTSIQQKIDADLLQRNIDEELSKNILLTSLYFAQLAYFSPSYIDNKMAKLGPSVLSVYNRNGVQAFFAEFNTFVVVAFKGQENDRWQEAKTDAKIWKTDFCGHRVHAGFAETLSYVDRRLHIDLDESTPGKRVLYTGHSFGGAMAMLLGLAVRPNDVVTFGAPRVFDNKLLKGYYDNVNVLRVENENDFVTSLPPRWAGYEHPGQKITTPARESRWQSHQIRAYLLDVIKGQYTYK